METSHEFKLVQGEFTPEEAGKLLYSLIQNKINYHNTEILSQQIRFGFGKDVSHAEQRIANLQKANSALIEFLKHAGSEGKLLEISGNFILNVVE